jgi:hypothetical protein
VGLFLAIIILGTGLTLAGIYENTLAIARVLKRSEGFPIAGTTSQQSDLTEPQDTLPTDLPLSIWHILFMGLIAAFVIWFLWFSISRISSNNNPAVENHATTCDDRKSENAPPAIGPDGNLLPPCAE